MRAVVIREPGGADVLELREVPRPEPGTGEIRVRVASSGVNRADLIQRRGGYPAPRGWPADTPGLEFAGTVESVGPGVTLWEVGDAVMGLVGGGGYAEELVTHERAAVRVPEGTSLVEAGAIPEVFMTAWDALFAQMELSAGETLLVHAAGSGVGTAAIQLARRAGVRTLGTSRTPAKLERALELGLDVGILGGADHDWPREVLTATGERGVDLVLDLVGGPYLERNLAVLAEGGRQIVVGVPGGSRAEIDLRALMGRRARIRGTVLRARPLEEKVALARAFETLVVPGFEAGQVSPVVDRRYPPTEAAEAHRRMEANRNFGKLILEWA